VVVAVESPSRELWRAVESIHAVTYFSEESLRASEDAGFKGFWMGYFACRSAPLGEAQPAVVEALFNNFSADRVNRALPDAWSFASPAAALAARSRGAEQALARLGVEPPSNQLLMSMQSAVMSIAPHGRPLFAANRVIPPEGVPLRDLWQWCTTIREHRGDGHVAALAVLGINGLEATILLAVDQGIDLELFEQSRGWHRDQIARTVERLIGIGLLQSRDQMSDSGRMLRSEVEEMTDRQAFAVISRLGDDYPAVLETLQAAAIRVHSQNEIPFPNPMGLPSGA
jgi:hypothetical protein